MKVKVQVGPACEEAEWGQSDSTHHPLWGVHWGLQEENFAAEYI